MPTILLRLNGYALRWKALDEDLTVQGIAEPLPAPSASSCGGAQDPLTTSHLRQSLGSPIVL